MSFSFKTILVPVDFSINTVVAVNKAVQVADSHGAVIHLVHLIQAPLYLNLTRAITSQDVIDRSGQLAAALKLDQWKSSIQQAMPGITVVPWIVMNASIRETIEKKAVELKADLIVIGKKSSHSWFPFLNTVTPDALAYETGAAVLTVKPGAMYNDIKTIVVPVSGAVPQHKMQTLSALVGKFKVKVHLVTYLEEDGEPAEQAASALLKVYQWLQQSLNCAVEYSVLKGGNKRRALLQYAEKISADMVLVDPASETRAGWLNTHISDLLPADSKMQVLSVQPAQL
jgi:nucleotide-binding universal stress UspA family protein